MFQKCPHLGCKPNFCESNFWFECPCHGSRYDRLGTKVKELGPAPRGMDHFPHQVQDGNLIVTPAFPNTVSEADVEESLEYILKKRAEVLKRMAN